MRLNPMPGMLFKVRLRSRDLVGTRLQLVVGPLTFNISPDEATDLAELLVDAVEKLHAEPRQVTNGCE